MAIVNSHGMTACEGLPKNCGRCGTNFVDYSDEGRMRVCAACKKPKASSRDLAAMLGQALSFREVQICNLVTGGKSNKEIAHELRLHDGTIKIFMSVILAKTGQPNRTALAIWWLLKTNDTLTALVAAHMGPN